MKVGLVVRNLLCRLLLIVITLIFLIPIIIFICIPEKYRYKYPIFFYPIHWFYVAILKGSLLPITYKGLENIPKDKPVIFAVSHQSSLDIAFLAMLSPGFPHVWVSKAELMESIFIKWF